MAALSGSWISFLTWWASSSRHRPVWETPAFHTQPDEQGGLKPQTTASLSWKSPCLVETDNDWILRRTQARGCLHTLCRTHLDSDSGLREWQGSWEICVRGGGRGGSEARGRRFSSSTHATTHCTLRMNHYTTLPWLWSQDRAYLPTAAHSRAHKQRARSRTTASSLSRGKRSQAPRPRR